MFSCQFYSVEILPHCRLSQRLCAGLPPPGVGSEPNDFFFCAGFGSTVVFFAFAPLSGISVFGYGIGTGPPGDGAGSVDSASNNPALSANVKTRTVSSSIAYMTLDQAAALATSN
jgi:hypothetical protein